MKKPLLEKVQHSDSYSFSIEKLSLPFFISRWHYHTDLELILFTDAFGTGFIGNGITSFSPGTLAMIGTYTPHVWLCYEEYYKDNPALVAEAVVIKFRENFLGPNFLQIPGVSRIRELFTRSKKGILFMGAKLDPCKKEIISLDQYDDLDKILKLLDILNQLSKTNDYRYISSIANPCKQHDKEYHRLDKVIKHVTSNFRRKITLEEVSELINLTPASFCRYFKARTLKSFTRFVNEVRIENACRLLIENKMSATQVCFESGFNQLSNFYRYFQEYKGMSPIDFRKEYWKERSFF